MNKRLAIISVTTIALLLTSGVSYAVINKDSSKANVVTTPAKQVSKVVEETKPVEVTQTTTAPVETAPVAQTVTPAPAPVYRSFDEIIMDYPTMSQGPREVACSKAIEAEFPYRFTQEKRETNVRIIAQKFVSSCAASFKGMSADQSIYADAPMKYLYDFDGTGDFWAKHGGL